MKRVEISAYGVPEEVAACVEVADMGPPGPGEVVFDVLLFPINPADIGFCQGSYRLRPPLPAVPGAECVGRVAMVGQGVSHVAPGDLVVNLQRENWAQRRLVRGEDVVKLPEGIDLRQAAMVRINPPTALLLLTEYVALKPGDWVIQNVANSAVGRLAIQLARRMGLKTLNVVRRERLFAELVALGADACVLDGEDLPARAAAAVGGAKIRLGLDAVSGDATGRIAECLADEGVVVNYGSMSAEDPHIPRNHVVFRGVSLQGFMLGRVLGRRDAAGIAAVYADLGGAIAEGRLHAKVDRVYPIEEIKAALAQAQQSGRDGKILVAPNGMI
jgi:mitochondrial enoyl-[acyl-carrier protein] reductase / trans-2-enoyl-CoA reductase